MLQRLYTNATLSEFYDSIQQAQHTTPGCPNNLIRRRGELFYPWSLHLPLLLTTSICEVEQRISKLESQLFQFTPQVLANTNKLDLLKDSLH